MEIPMKLLEKIMATERCQNRGEEMAQLESCLQKLIAESCDYLLIAKLCLNLAEVRIRTRQPEALKQARELIDRSGNYLQQHIQHHQNDLEGGISTSLTNCWQAKWHYVQAALYLETRNMDDGLSCLQTALQMSQEMDTQALIYGAMGKFYMQTNHFAEARIHFEKALAIGLDLNHEPLMGASYANLGGWYLLMGDSEQAGNLYQNGFDIAIASGDYELRSQCLRGVAQVAIAQSRWQDAITILEDAITQLQEPTDTVDIGYLYCDLTEALLCDRQIEKSLFCVRVNVLPRFRELHYSRGVTIARYLRGKIYTQRIYAGLDPLDADAIETAEDSLLDASLAFEQNGMMLDYAHSLYELANLYQLSCTSQYHYQYQGKALRSLELALSVLEQLELYEHPLTQQVDKMLIQLMQEKL
jgi:tetratricopeptide (TPR) repeat protein